MKICAVSARSHIKIDRDRPQTLPDLGNPTDVDFWVWLFEQWENKWTDSEYHKFFNEILEIGQGAFIPQAHACFAVMADGPTHRARLVKEMAGSLTLRLIVTEMTEPERGAFFGVYPEAIEEPKEVSMAVNTATSKRQSCIQPNSQRAHELFECIPERMGGVVTPCINS
jgi:hypothetical protein